MIFKFLLLGITLVFFSYFLLLRRQLKMIRAEYPHATGHTCRFLISLALLACLLYASIISLFLLGIYTDFFQRFF